MQLAMGLQFFDTGHRYELDGAEIPSVSEIIRFLSREVYGDIDKYVLDNAADRGTRVHQATERIDKLGVADCDLDIVGYVQAYVQFRRDHSVKWDAIELPLAHRDKQYAGTIDRRGMVDGQYCTLDIKTSAVIKKTLVKAQLNGYEDMARSNGLPPADVLYCLQLKPAGKYALYPAAIDNTEFAACLALHAALRKKHRRMKIE